MLVATFSLGILGGGMAVLSLVAIGPVVEWFSAGLKSGVESIINAGLLPFVLILIEPGQGAVLE